MPEPMNDEALAIARQTALERAAAIEQAPPEPLVVEDWTPPVELQSPVWEIRNPDIEPPQYRRIAVVENTGALWLNDPYGVQELAQFLTVEDLPQRLAQDPEAMARLLVALGYDGLQVLHSLTDIPDLDEAEREQVEAHRSAFAPPHWAKSGRLVFWTYSYRNGSLERWQVEFSMGLLTVEREPWEEGLGVFLPRL